MHVVHPQDLRLPRSTSKNLEVKRGRAMGMDIHGTLLNENAIWLSNKPEYTLKPAPALLFSIGMPCLSSISYTHNLQLMAL